MSSTAFSMFLLAATAILFAIAFRRLSRTQRRDPERGARADMVRLLATMLVGVGGSLLRLLFAPRSLGFLLISFALAPAGFFALYLLLRLFRAYKGMSSHKPEAALPGVDEIKARIGAGSDSRGDL